MQTLKQGLIIAVVGAVIGGGFTLLAPFLSDLGADKGGSIYMEGMSSHNSVPAALAIGGNANANVSIDIRDERIGATGNSVVIKSSSE